MGLDGNSRGREYEPNKDKIYFEIWEKRLDNYIIIY
jgi:hypothetical protein